MFFSFFRGCVVKHGRCHHCFGGCFRLMIPKVSGLIWRWYFSILTLLSRICSKSPTAASRWMLSRKIRREMVDYERDAQCYMSIPLRFKSAQLCPKCLYIFYGKELCSSSFLVLQKNVVWSNNALHRKFHLIDLWHYFSPNLCSLCFNPNHGWALYSAIKKNLTEILCKFPLNRWISLKNLKSCALLFQTRRICDSIHHFHVKLDASEGQKTNLHLINLHSVCHAFHFHATWIPPSVNYNLLPQKVTRTVYAVWVFLKRLSLWLTTQWF